MPELPPDQRYAEAIANLRKALNDAASLNVEVLADRVAQRELPEALNLLRPLRAAIGVVDLCKAIVTFPDVAFDRIPIGTLDNATGAAAGVAEAIRNIDNFRVTGQ